jgi:iron complex transport system substrate-binding protein
MKTCSFLPAATRMIYDMGLEDLLYGVTFECPEEALAEKPKLVRCIMEGKNYSSKEIDTVFSAAKAQGKSLYYVEEELLQEIAPDIIFTQDTCEVCGIDTRCTATAVAKLKKRPLIIPLTPGNLEDVYATAITIATALGREEAAYRYLAALWKRTDRILDTLRQNKMPMKRVLLLEWIDPMYNCGHWVPFQTAQAGGIDMLSNPGGDSIVISWDKIRRYDPEVIIVAPCGFHIHRAAEELHLLTEKEGWWDIRAVQTGQVFLADSDLFTQPSASTLVDGIELLAALFHAELFALPGNLEKKTIPWRSAAGRKGDRPADFRSPG